MPKKRVYKPKQIDSTCARLFLLLDEMREDPKYRGDPRVLELLNAAEDYIDDTVHQHDLLRTQNHALFEAIIQARDHAWGALDDGASMTRLAKVHLMHISKDCDKIVGGFVPAYGTARNCDVYRFVDDALDEFLRDRGLKPSDKEQLTAASYRLFLKWLYRVYKDDVKYGRTGTCRSEDSKSS